MKEEIKNKAYQLATMLGEIDNETRRTGRVDMSVDEFNEIYGLASDINEELNKNGIVNPRIDELAEIANKMGLKVIITNWETPEQTDISFTIPLGNDKDYSTYISVSPDADAREISDQLYMLADDFNEEFVESDTITELKELDYTDMEIDTIRRTINILLKNHLSLREKKLGLVD